MSSSPSHTQTLSFLKRRFEERGIDPRKKLGQHFLIDLNLRDLVLRTARLGPDDVVLEVGTGTGSLTAPMAAVAAAVVTVEVDPQMFALAADVLDARANVDMLQADVLKNKNRINPTVLEAVDQRLRAAPARRFKLVANLPYNIATPILGNLLALDVPPRTMTVTIQKELADRIVARPGTKDYGSLSIWIQSQCRAEIVRVMPPSVFWPRPKVDSAIVQIEVDDALRGRIADRRVLPGFHPRAVLPPTQVPPKRTGHSGKAPAGQAGGGPNPRRAPPRWNRPRRDARRRHRARAGRGVSRRLDRVNRRRRRRAQPRSQRRSEASSSSTTRMSVGPRASRRCNAPRKRIPVSPSAKVSSIRLAMNSSRAFRRRSARSRCSRRC